MQDIAIKAHGAGIFSCNTSFVTKWSELFFLVKFVPNVERSGVDSSERQGPLLPTPDLEHQLHQGLKECEEPLTGLMTDLFR